MLSRTRRAPRGLGLLAAALALLAAGGCAPPDYGVAPFRCTGSSGECPVGYHCDTSTCVSNSAGSRVPVFLSATVDDGADAFSIHPRRADVVVCWRQSASSRLRELDGVVLNATGGVVVAPRPYFREDTTSVSTLFDLTGDCTALGDDVVVVVVRTVAQARQLQQHFLVDPILGTSRSLTPDEVFFSLDPFLGSRTTTFNVVTVGETAVWAFPRQPGEVDLRRNLYRSSIGPERTEASESLNLPGFGSGTNVLDVNAIGAADGAWIVTQTDTGGSLVAWVPTGTAGDHNVRNPALPEVRGYPLAVRDRDLAMAYHVDATHWQIFWIRPAAAMGGGDAGMDPDASTDAGPTAEMVTAGPRFEAATDVLRPGGVLAADGATLVVASATQPTAVDVLEVTWGSASSAAPRRRPSITKISRLTPRQLALTRLGGSLLAAWTERVPANAAGFAQYFALYAAAVP